MNIFRGAHTEFLTLFKKKNGLLLTSVTLVNNVSFKSFGSLALSPPGLLCEMCPTNLSQLCSLFSPSPLHSTTSYLLYVLYSMNKWRKL